jgi:hypothetical protein
MLLAGRNVDCRPSAGTARTAKNPAASPIFDHHALALVLIVLDTMPHDLCTTTGIFSIAGAVGTVRPSTTRMRLRAGK